MSDPSNSERQPADQPARNLASDAALERLLSQCGSESPYAVEPARRFANARAKLLSKTDLPTGE